MWRSPRLWVAIAALVTIPLLALVEPLERSAFDARLGMRTAGDWPADLVAVPIDDATLDRRGRWPWSRGRIAELLLAMKHAGAKTIAFDLVIVGETDPVADLELERALGDVVIAVSGTRQGVDAPFDERTRGALLSVAPPRLAPMQARHFVLPHGRFTSAAGGIGHVLSFPAKDQIIRSHTPLLPIAGAGGSLPSLALASLARQRGWPPESIALDGTTLLLPENRRLRLYNGDAYLDWAPRHVEPPRRVSAERVLSGRAEKELEGALAVLYIDSETSSDRANAPSRGVIPGGLVVANAIRTLDLGRVPRPLPILPTLATLVALLLVFATRLAKGSPRELVGTGAILAFVIIAMGSLLVPLTDVFVPIASPSVLVIVSFVALAIRADRLADAERKHLKDLLAAAAKLPHATIGDPEERATVASDFRPRESTLGALASGSPLARPVDVGGRYTVTRCLGRGGMGAIFLAHDNELDRDVALKVLTAQEPVAFERFRREAQAVARIDHTNVVRIHEIGADAEVPFLVIEYLSGGSVAEWFRGYPQNAPWPPPWQQSIDKIRDAAAGLGAAHALGIVHRDVKPANLLLSGEGAVKIADFGIAKLGGSATLTREGSMVGTIGYLSPEQATGVDVDPRSDVYSLGITWYRLLTGRSAFEGTTAEILRRQVSASVNDPRRHVPNLPDPIAELVLRMAALERGDRPEDGRAVVAEIDRIRPLLR